MFKPSILLLSLYLMTSGYQIAFKGFYRPNIWYLQTLFYSGPEVRIFGSILFAVGIFLFLGYFKGKVKYLAKLFFKKQVIVITTFLIWLIAIFMPTVNHYFQIPTVLIILFYLVAIFSSLYFHFILILIIINVKKF